MEYYKSLDEMFCQNAAIFYCKKDTEIDGVMIGRNVRMTKEDLIEYKEKLGKLSKKEQQMRKLYLKRISEGEIFGPNLEYLSISMSWLKYYDDKVIFSEIPDMTIYEYLCNKNKNNMSNCALNYYGTKITYDDLLKTIEKVAKSFQYLGVEKGNIVTVCLFNVPEAIYILYALNMIGAIVNFVDPRTNVERMKYFCNETNSKILIIFDMINEKIDGFVKDTDITDIVTVSISDSLPLAKSMVYNKSHKQNIKKIINVNNIKWKEFCALSKYVEKLNKTDFSKNMPCAMVLTGGTTGIPKAVPLTNENLNAMAMQYELSGVPHSKRENKFLDIMPPFLAYGLVNGIHMPLSLGMQNILITKIVPEELAKTILKYKPNHFMGVPNHMEVIADSKEMEGKDLSFIITAGAGGDSTTIEQEKKFNNFAKLHNISNMLQKGFGMTEGASAMISTLSNETNKLGSVGIPLPLNVVGIFEPDTETELPIGEKGEICILTPTMMQGYLNNPSETGKVIKTHSDGTKWIHTGDLGYMDREGFTYHLNRIKRMIVRPDGHNVFPSVIENLLITSDKIKQCIVVGVDSEFDTKGQYPKVTIVLNDEDIDKEELIKELDKMCSKEFPERDVPYYYEFVQEIPKTLAGKDDYRAIEKLGVKNAYKSSKYYIDFH